MPTSILPISTIPKYNPEIVICKFKDDLWNHKYCTCVYYDVIINYCSVQVLNVVTVSHGVLYTRGGKWSLGFHCPQGWQNPWTRHIVQQFFVLHCTFVTWLFLLSKFFCHHQTLFTTSTCMHSLISRQTVVKIRNNSSMFHRVCGHKRWKSTNAGNDQVNVHRLTKLMLPAGAVQPWYSIQLLHAVTGSMAFCTPKGQNGTGGEAKSAICHRGCTKPMDPSHSMQQLFCYTLVTWLFLFSKFCCQTNSSNKKQIFTCSLKPTCFVQLWKSTNGGNDQVDVHRCTSLFMLPGALCITRSANF